MNLELYWTKTFKNENLRITSSGKPHWIFMSNIAKNYLFSTAERIIAAVTLTIFAAGCFLVGFFNPTTAGFFPACPLLAMTGYACPGCGLTRGFHALFHGDFWTAISYNALIPIYCIIFLYAVGYLFSIIFRGRGLYFNFTTPKPLFAFLAISLIFGILRNVPIEPFTFFYP